MIKTSDRLEILSDKTGKVETVLTVEMLKEHLQLRVKACEGYFEINLYYDDELITGTTL